MNIIDLQLQFDTDNLSLGNTPKYIGLHHSGGIGTVNAYHEMHKNKGWAGLGYNFFVDLNGKIRYESLSWMDTKTIRCHC